MPGICPRCDKNVYFAEEVKGLGQSWHKLCFTCQACRKMLTSGAISEHDNQVFCNACYRKNYGPKGYGYGVGSGTLSMDDGQGYKTNPNAIDHKAQAYVAPKKPLVTSNTDNNKVVANSTDAGALVPEPLLWRREGSDIENDDDDDNGDSDVACDGNLFPYDDSNGTNDGAYDPLAYLMKLKGGLTKDKKPKWGGADICPRCDKSVFIAELMRGAGKAWHKSCFTCQICNKRVDSSMLCEREGEIYCKSCYGRNFGPKGVGYGIGAGTLQTN